MTGCKAIPYSITENMGHFDYLHLVYKPDKLSVSSFCGKNYMLLIKLFIKAYREKVYDFIDYKDYIKSSIREFFEKNTIIKGNGHG